MKNILLSLVIVGFSGCEIKTQQFTTPDTANRAEIDTETPESEWPCDGLKGVIYFEDRIFSTLEGDRLLAFYPEPVNMSESEIREKIEDVFPGSEVTHPGNLVCMVDGQGPYGCSGPLFLLDFGSQELNDDFAAHCIDQN